MKYIVPILFISISTLATGQSFNSYKDTINRFSIYIPVGWKYGVSKSQPTVKFIAYNTSDTIKFNYNLNVIETPNLTLDETSSKFLKYISQVEGFKLLDSGHATISGRVFTWVIESHLNESNHQTLMHNFDFVTYAKDKTYILTMVAFSKNFDQIFDTFSKIANSFKLLD